MILGRRGRLFRESRKNAFVQGMSGGGGFTTFYVRPAGSSYGTGDGSSYDNAWAGFSNIVWASVENNVLAICGTHTEALNVGGDNLTIIGNDPNEAGVIDGEDIRATGVDIPSRNNVTITSLTVINHTTQNLLIQGTSAGITTNDCIFNGSGNQGIQHFNTCSATHNNPTCNNNVDDGISLHDSATVIINGGAFTGNDVGVNTIADSTTTINDPVTMSGNISQDVWATGATTDESCIINLNNCTLTNIVRATDGAKVVANNCNLANVDISDGTGTGFFTATDTVCEVLVSNDASCIFTNCLVTWSGTIVSGDVDFRKSRVLNDARVSNGVTLKARHTLFSGGNDMQLDFENGSTADIAYCVFYNISANQFGTAFRTGTTITNYHNNTIVGVANVGRGLFAQEPNTAQNLIFTDLDVAAFQNTGAQTLENCCFFDNNNDKFGTFTSNDEVTTDPVLVDATNLDFSLGVGSSCIGAGETLTDDEGILSADWGNGIDETPSVTTAAQPASWNIGAYVNQ